MNGLDEAIATVEGRRKTIEVYAPSPDPSRDFSDQFSSRNVSVTHCSLPSGVGDPFVIIRDADGRFLGSLGLDAFDAFLSPEIHPPWVLSDGETDYGDLFDFFDNTVFSSFDRRQMLATAREIEERAWRIGSGRLYAGFQRVDALRAQQEVYARLSGETELSVQLYVDADWDVTVNEQVPVHAEPAEEIGDYWFVLYAGDDDVHTCGLLAEERQPGAYYGFWTYDVALVGELVSYLESEYGSA